MEDIKINFSSNHLSIMSKCILGMTYYKTKDYVYNKNNNIISFKRIGGKIDISLFAHLLKHKDIIEKGDLKSLIEELIDTIVHELIHYVGEYRSEVGTREATKVLLNKYSKSFIPIIEVK